MSLRWVSRSSSNYAISASAAAIWRSRDGRDIIYIARVSAAGSRINQVSVGTRLPVHCTSLGRMLLTDVSRSEFEQLFPDERLSRAMRRASCTTAKRCGMVQQDKARGYVIGESFYRHGISSIVYPVFNRSGRVAAVVSILVPSDEIPQSDRERLQNDVSMAADKISRLPRIFVTGKLNQQINSRRLIASGMFYAQIRATER